MNSVGIAFQTGTRQNFKKIFCLILIFLYFFNYFDVVDIKNNFFKIKKYIILIYF